MTVDYPDWATPQAHATSIYNQRVPLARGTVSVNFQNTQTLAAAGSVFLQVPPVIDQPAYEFSIACKLPAGALGVPFVRIIFTWLDVASGFVIAERSYILASGDNISNVGRLIGGIRAGLLDIQLNNLHQAQSLTYSWAFNTISHIVSDDDYANDTTVAVSGFTPPGGDPSAGTLAVVNAAVAPGTPQLRLLAATNRRCKVTVDNTGQANACDVQVSDPSPAAALYGSTAGAQFWRSGSVAAGAVLTGEYQMPNGPALLTITNLGATGNITPKVTITTMRT